MRNKKPKPTKDLLSHSSSAKFDLYKTRFYTTYGSGIFFDANSRKLSQLLL